MIGKVLLRKQMRIYKSAVMNLRRTDQYVVKLSEEPAFLFKWYGAFGAVASLYQEKNLVPHEKKGVPDCWAVGKNIWANPLRAQFPFVLPLGSLPNYHTMEWPQDRNGCKMWWVVLPNCSLHQQTKIGHFRVPKNLTFKTRLSAKPLLWKWVLLA